MIKKLARRILFGNTRTTRNTRVPSKLSARAFRSRFIAFERGWIAAGGWAGDRTLGDASRTHWAQVAACSGPSVAYAIGYAAATQAAYHNAKYSTLMEDC